MPTVPGIDTSVAHPARIYDYWLGGKDNFAADREAGELALRAYPELAQAVWSNRAFLARAVKLLAGEIGIRQFLDIGPGIPASDNTHEVAQAIAPDSRIVYVDNDPVVLQHARVLLKSRAGGACDYLLADLRDPDAIVAAAAETLDFSQPIALILRVLQQIPDKEDPWRLVSHLVGALPAGSYLVISHPTDDFNPNNKGESMARYNERVRAASTLRGKEETGRFFAGLELAEPGVVPVSRWRPDSELTAARPASMWCGVARKPGAGFQR